MNTSEKKIREFSEFKPRDFPYVEKIELTESTVDDEPFANVRLHLRPRMRSDQRRLVLDFFQSGQIQLGPFPGIIQLIDINIRYIGDRQWQTFNYQVVETEENALSLFCSDFAVQMM